MHHDVSMRTTINIEDDLAERLKAEAHAKNRSFTNVVNETIRAGLKPEAPSPQRYRTVPWDAGRLAPGIDPTKFNQLAEELEDEVLIERVRRHV